MSTDGRSPTRPASPAWGRGKTLLLEAARAVFTEKGYAASSTKEIAERASVTEPMVFRHFGSKAKLFEEAVLAPFNDYMATYMADWESRPHGVVSPVQEARDFYRGLYDVLTANQRLIRALIAAQDAHGPLSDATTGAPQLGAILERFEDITRQEGGARGFRSFDPTVLTRLMFGLVFSIAVHGDWMFEGATARRPPVEAFIEEMAQLTIHGAYPRPDHPSWENSGTG
ncbi:TetR/AcrR family transcriptional regulator [Nocardia sp. NPDC059246]|uniref:TetR/AcrR family transcriptional regulator n=1 Tax=unclassified Nocardia TaxID=2637762 RepID=UPI0036C2A0E6